MGWIEKFPESQHGPIWLEAFESSYLESFVKKISPNLEKLIETMRLKKLKKSLRNLVHCFRLFFVLMSGRNALEETSRKFGKN
ncbi:MAG: hypothetical protein Ct9H300mP23_03950 [Nitrospinota bacterium]|nr:MAG: hypothetical protein Ct9H300mP23_03950 [Nitrospinota bacterium]